MQNFANVILVCFLSIYSNVIMPLKTLVFLLRLLVIPDMNKQSDVMGYIMSSWVLADWIISLIVDLIKFSYLRSLGGHLGASGVGNSSSSSDTWGKMNGYSEEAVEIGLISFAVLTALSTNYEGIILLNFNDLKNGLRT